MHAPPGCMLRQTPRRQPSREATHSSCRAAVAGRFRRSSPPETLERCSRPRRLPCDHAFSGGLSAFLEAICCLRPFLLPRATPAPLSSSSRSTNAAGEASADSSSPGERGRLKHVAAASGRGFFSVCRAAAAAAASELWPPGELRRPRRAGAASGRAPDRRLRPSAA